MVKLQKITDKTSRAFAKVALKVGIASSNSACRFGYYQNKIPVTMSKYKK